MQAIRVLRAQSRPASPALANPVHEPNMVSSAGYNGPKMANPQGQTLIEEQSQQRPTSAMARIQSLTPFHKRATPTPPPTPLPSTIVQDGTYLNTLGLKLNEAASRVLITANGTGPDVWKGKKPLPSGRGRQFAALIETEMDASQGNSNLRHAILRLLPRSLSVVISTLSAQISLLIPTPGFVPSSVMALPHPATLHALAYASFAAEVLETFVTYKLGTTNQDLIIARTSLEAIVTRVTAPLFTQMQSEMVALIEPLGQRSTSGTSSPSGGKLPKPHSAIATINQHLPHFSKALKRCTFPSCASTQSALASFFITSIWQALVQISHRQPPVKGSQVSLAVGGIGPTPPHSPALKKASLPASPAMKKLTPPSSPPAKKRVLPLSDSPPKLSLRLRQVPSAGSLVSRAASPDIRHKDPGLIMTVYPSTSWVASSLVDAKAILELFASTELPRPSESSLAREAVDEAVERLATFKEWLAASVMDGRKLIEHAPEDLPLLIVLPLVVAEAWLDYSAQGSCGESEYVCMGRLIGYENNDAYRRNVLCGFGRAEECEAIIGGRVLERLKAMDRWEIPNHGTGEGWIGGVVRWLDSQLPSN